ncbi:MAG: H-NS histone family protein [Betaproteobacteria bacterium]|nr:MAG: H-NS histone family protein [Betaproteobacteria bacterium]
MAKTYAQIQKQIDTLKREADRLKRKEADGVIARIKEAVLAYGLTASDLGLGGASSVKRAAPVAKRARRKSKTKYSPTVKFRDTSGNTWVGRGPRPQWLRDALKAGKSLQDYAV